MYGFYQFGIQGQRAAPIYIPYNIRYKRVVGVCVQIVLLAWFVPITVFVKSHWSTTPLPTNAHGTVTKLRRSFHEIVWNPVPWKQSQSVLPFTQTLNFQAGTHSFLITETNKLFVLKHDSQQIESHLSQDLKNRQQLQAIWSIVLCTLFTEK